jgi:two-component system C4-dicarboxylate transport sensor histidine kinase DctB
MESELSAGLMPMRQQLLGQLAGALWHELERPVTALLNEADSADLMLRRGALPEVRACVGNMRLLGEQLAELLAQLGDHAWCPGGSLTPADVRESLDSALGALGIFEGRHANGVAVHLICAPERPAVVLAQPGRLEQVLMNLLRNALEATAQLGPAGRVEVRILREAAVIQVSVSDNGRGLSPAVLSHLVDPFFIAKHARAHLGLGLVISRLIAEDLGGGLSACNAGAVGAGGAVFSLWLPDAADGHRA